MDASLTENRPRLADTLVSNTEAVSFVPRVFTPFELEWLGEIMGDSGEIECNCGAGKLYIRKVGAGHKEIENVPLVEGLEGLFPKYSMFVEAGGDMHMVTVRADGVVFISSSENEAVGVEREIAPVAQAVRELIVGHVLLQIGKLLSGSDFKSARAHTDIGDEQISIWALKDGGYEFQYTIRYDGQSSRVNTITVEGNGRVTGSARGLPEVWWLKERFEMLAAMQRCPVFKLGDMAPSLGDGFMLAHIPSQPAGLPDLDSLLVDRWPATLPAERPQSKPS